MSLTFLLNGNLLVMMWEIPEMSKEAVSVPKDDTERQ